MAVITHARTHARKQAASPQARRTGDTNNPHSDACACLATFSTAEHTRLQSERCDIPLSQWYRLRVRTPCILPKHTWFSSAHVCRTYVLIMVCHNFLIGKGHTCALRTTCVLVHVYQSTIPVMLGHNVHVHHWYWFNTVLEYHGTS